MTLKMMAKANLVRRDHSVPGAVLPRARRLSLLFFCQ